VAVSDGVMIQMMARENSEVYQTDVAVLLESVRTAVAALAARQISGTEMPAPHENAHKFQVVMLHRLLLVITLMVLW